MEDHKKIILLLDDDPDFLEINGALLENQGYVVLRCDTIAEALKRAEEVRPDLIITDLMMDRLDAGFDFARRIKEHPGLSQTSIIMVTAASRALGFDLSPRSETDLGAMHVDAWLDKPVTSTALLSAVRGLLDTSAHEEEP